VIEPVHQGRPERARPTMNSVGIGAWPSWPGWDR
jgi:hypothetical protein